MLLEDHQKASLQSPDILECWLQKKNEKKEQPATKKAAARLEAVSVVLSSAASSLLLVTTDAFDIWNLRGDGDLQGSLHTD